MKKSMRKLSQEEIRSFKRKLEEVVALKRRPIVLVVDDVRSLFNIGSFFRTADAFLLEKIYLCGISGRPPQKEIEKTALGTVEAVPWQYYEKIGDCLEDLKGRGYQIVALEQTNQSRDYKEVKYDFPLALVVGNEIDGVGKVALEKADLAVEIDMAGRASSLNVANAFAIVIAEIANQNRGK
ncbi:MAG: TrmH family RNA methyltransferase [Candidatus Altimarinota bacterium]